MTTNEARLRGVRKAYQIISNPDPSRLRALRMKITQRDMVGEAWRSTGQSLDWAMKAELSKLR